jgi:RNA polymerase sigma factor (TIGR02999 family)
MSSDVTPAGGERRTDPDAGEITRLLRRWQDGDIAAREALIEVVYDQVRIIASQAIRASPGATLSATDLAHESLLRLLGAKAKWEDRRHFYNVVAKATRQVLVDAARRRLRDKRGSGIKPVSLTQAQDVAVADDETMLRVNDALEQLGRRDERRARVLELTYFGGFEREEIAGVLDISVPTVDRDLRFGKAWLKRALEA